MQILIRLVGEYDGITDLIYKVVDECKKPGVNSFVEINPVKLS